MKHKQVEYIAATVFALAGLVHLLRLALGWDIVVGTWAVPIWLSGVLVLLAGWLSYSIMEK